MLQSCEQITSIRSSGTTIDGSLWTGPTGVIIKTSKLSCNTGPPIDKE